MSAAAKPRLIFPKPVEIKNILFTTDFSPTSELALRYAQAIARRYGSKVFILHVLPEHPRLAVPLDQFPQEFDAARRDAAQQMEQLMSNKMLADIPHDAVLEHGTVQQVVMSTITEREIDLVVLGTHGHHGLKKVLLGSVAEVIFRLARCPVLTVGPEIARDGLPEGDFPGILFATDLSEDSLRALPWALSLAQENRARLILVHVITDISEGAMDYLDEMTAACKQRLVELLPPGAGAWCQPEFFVEFGPAADTILKVADERQISLIVMGARHRAIVAASTHLPWATASRVVCHAHCPVLTVRS